MDKVLSGVFFFAEHFALYARSGIIGYAYCPSYLWFQVFRRRTAGQTNGRLNRKTKLCQICE
ncbi:hypothetical protein D1AOALGA4SA_3045 [Olavius algarvensis Delta 1 endosymbiont]|nr:hypothetical protein D1AOALGA4SA_3045 [Olavius algarvensis Delta 1 endosymbiont]